MEYETNDILQGWTFTLCETSVELFKKKNFMAPFYGWSSTASRLQSHYDKTVIFLDR